MPNMDVQAHLSKAMMTHSCLSAGEANFLGGVARKYGVDFDPVIFKRRFFEIYISKASATVLGVHSQELVLSVA